jgi:ZIP family zinc transporter
MTSIVVFTGICLHNFPEGMAVYLSTLKGWNLGLTIAIAIGMHNVPEGIVVASTTYAATKSKWKTLQYTFLSGMAEPIGALAFSLFFHKYLTERAVYCMLSGVAGIMTYICVAELIPSSFKYIRSRQIIMANVFGMIVIYLCSILLHVYEV